MSLAVLRSRALLGIDAPPVTVEVHLANGLPSFTLVGLADTEVKEARERVRAALHNSGLFFPHNKRITVSLAPADLPKDSGRFDLPIALGILAASAQIDPERLVGHEFAGELSLAGELRPVRGALAMALALQRSSPGSALVLPACSAEEAALVDGLRCLRAGHLLDVVRAMRHNPDDRSCAEDQLQAARPLVAAAAASGPDLREVRGQASAKRALALAATGGHSLLLIGPPGTGKSMLAQRLAGLMPPLSQAEALESAAILSLVGRFSPAGWRQRVVRAPHHSASAAALVGGGAPPRPGEISLAHAGILFLDELPEYPRAALEALREPLETGRITISRAMYQTEFPARFQLVAAMNPCACGQHGSPTGLCRCTPESIARYQGRLSGPLLDRIDLQVEVPAIAPATLAASPNGEPSAVVAARVAAARAMQFARQQQLNASLAGEALDQHCRLAPAARQFLHNAATRLAWSARSHHRVLRVARSAADLAQSDEIGIAHLAEAIQFRRVLAAR